MSAVLREAPRFEPMRETELPSVLEIENAIYEHPWTRGNFADSLRAGYQCWTYRLDRRLLGYFVLIVAAGEAHLLNLSVAAQSQRRGYGAALLAESIRIARALGGRNVYLEVRPTNLAAQALYARFGFRHVALRRGYYPAGTQREDALVFTLPL
jgi:[ribosomal protein S18]-alanine N-acetyltransferase